MSGIKEERANFSRTFSEAIALRARAKEAEREIDIAPIKDRRREISFKELELGYDRAKAVTSNYNKARRLLQLLLAQYPERKEQIIPMLDKVIAEWSHAMEMTEVFQKRVFDETPMIPVNPFADSAKPFRIVRPNPSMIIHEVPMPETVDRNASDDDDLETLREDAEQMLSGLSSILTQLSGSTLTWLQNKLAKIIEEV